jgi:transcriptional regulator with XRE-family HTH domain
MLARTPDPLDVLVGARIRILRKHRGMSQGVLAGKIGVSFQQVQKYEKGTNRVGASRLSCIASVLGISVGELFESSETASVAAKSPFRLLAERDALRVLTAFSRTTNPRLRRAITKLLESVADRQSAGKPSTVRAAAAKRRRTTPAKFLRDTAPLV